MFICLSFFPTLYRLPGFKLSVNALLASLGPHTLGHLSVFSTLYRLPGFKLGVNALLTSLGPHTVVHLSVFFPYLYRVPGFKLSANALLALLIMSGTGVTTALLRRYTDIDLAAMAGDLVKKVIDRQ